MAEYSKLTVVKLKEELKQRGLPQTGLKAVLVTRLEEDDAAKDQVEEDEATQNQESEAPEPPPQIAQEPPVHPPTSETQSVHESENAAELPTEPSTEKEEEPNRTEDAANVEEQTRMAIAEPEIEPEKVQASNASEDTAAADALPIPAVVDETSYAADDTLSKNEPDVQVKSLGRPEEQDSSMAIDPPDHQTQDQQSSIPKIEEPAAPAQNDAESAAANQSLPEHIQVDASTKSQDMTQSRSSMTPLPTTETQPPSRPDVDETMIQTEVLPSDTQDALMEDSRKRKRRSHSPQPSTQDVAMKRMKAQDGSPKLIPIDEADAHVPKAQADQAEPTGVPEPISPAKTSPVDTRFKNLFAARPAPLQSLQVEDRDLTPAVHAATTALYIRNFMRPLHPATLKDHLTALAHPGPDSSDDNSVVEFFLDTIKSHCLVQFSSTAAAARVRLALHDNVWPDERSRKALWVDYVPEEKIKKWIEVEQDAASSRPPKRWEVVYEKEGEGVAAYLQEADSGSRKLPPAPEPSRNGRSAPTSPKVADSKVKIPTGPRGDSGRGFKALDDLFKSTMAKPKLYFQPVPVSVANKRLDRLALGRGGGRGDETRRYTFEDETLVENGPEYGQGWRGNGRGRGGHSGGPPPRGGGYRGRGGDSWRSDY